MHGTTSHLDNEESAVSLKPIFVSGRVATAHTQANQKMEMQRPPTQYKKKNIHYKPISCKQNVWWVKVISKTIIWPKQCTYIKLESIQLVSESTANSTIKKVFPTGLPRKQKQRLQAFDHDPQVVDIVNHYLHVKLSRASWLQVILKKFPEHVGLAMIKTKDCGNKDLSWILWCSC